MATFTRRNAWNNNGTFDNSDLLWYAKGVGVMQSRSLDDPPVGGSSPLYMGNTFLMK
jgi:hypothetical protein